MNGDERKVCVKYSHLMRSDGEGKGESTSYNYMDSKKERAYPKMPKINMMPRDGMRQTSFSRPRHAEHYHTGVPRPILTGGLEG